MHQIPTLLALSLTYSVVAASSLSIPPFQVYPKILAMSSQCMMLEDRSVVCFDTSKDSDIPLPVNVRYDKNDKENYPKDYTPISIAGGGYPVRCTVLEHKQTKEHMVNCYGSLFVDDDTIYTLPVDAGSKVVQVGIPVSNGNNVCIIARKDGRNTNDLYCFAKSNSGLGGTASQVGATDLFRAKLNDLANDASMNPIKVSPGEQYTCVLYANAGGKGTVKCFGDNINQAEPTFGANDNPIDMCIGDDFNCVLTQNTEDDTKSIACLGLNNFNNGNPYSVQDKEFKSVHCGSNFACALFEDDGVRCWGANSYGQLGDDTTDNAEVPPTEDINFYNENKNVAIVDIHLNGQFMCTRWNDSSVKCHGQTSENVELMEEIQEIGLTNIDDRAGVCDEDRISCECGQMYDQIQEECVEIGDTLSVFEELELYANYAACMTEESDTRFIFAGTQAYRCARQMFLVRGIFRLPPDAPDHKLMVSFMDVLETIMVDRDPEGQFNQQYVEKDDMKVMHSKLFSLVKDFKYQMTSVMRRDVEPFNPKKIGDQQVIYGGFIPPFTYAFMQNEDNNELAKLEFLSQRKSDIEDLITVVEGQSAISEGQNAISQQIRDSFTSLFDGLAEAADQDVKVAKNKQALVKEAIESLFKRAEANLKGFQKESENAQIALTRTFEAKDALMLAQEKLAEAQAAKAMFDAILNIVTGVATLAVTGAKFLASNADNLFDTFVDLEGEIVKATVTIIGNIDALDAAQGAVDQDSANLKKISTDLNSEIGTDIDAEGVYRNMNATIADMKAISSMVLAVNHLISNSLRSDANYDQVNSVNLNLPAEVWDGNELTMRSMFSMLNICKADLLVGRRRRLADDGDVETDNTSNLRLMQLRAHTPGAITNTGRSLESKEEAVENAEEEVQESKGVLDSKCVIFVNTWKATMVRGKGFHNDIIEAAELFRSYRAALYEIEAAEEVKAGWEQRKEKNENVALPDILTMKRNLEMELTFNELLLEDEFIKAQLRLRELCDSIMYNSPMDSTVCNEGAIKYAKLRGAEQYLELLGDHNDLQRLYRDTLITHAVNGRTGRTQKLDISKYVDMENFKSTGSLSLSLDPAMFQDDDTNDLFCARNVEAGHVGIVAVGSTPGVDLRFQTSLSGPYYKVVETSEGPRYLEFTGAIEGMRYNYEYGMSDRCEASAQVEVCDMQLCQRLDAGSGSQYLSLPPLFATYNVQLTKGSVNDLVNATGVVLVFESQLSYADANECTQNSVQQSCSWEAKTIRETSTDTPNNTAMIVGISAGVLGVVAVVVAVVVTTKQKSAKRELEEEKRMSAVAQAQPVQAEFAQNGKQLSGSVL